MGRVAIVIPTWNRRDLLARVLDDLARQTYPIERLIVVDNGSADDSVAVARGAGAEVIEMGENRGFAAAVNRGVESVHTSVNAARTSACATAALTTRVTGESQKGTNTGWIGVLNNDVQLERDWLERLVTQAEAQGAAFASGKLLDAAAHDRVEGTFDGLCRGGCAWRCGHGRLDSEVWNQPRTIQLAPFTAAIFRSDVFDRVGLLDEQFESYLEDVDFGLRCARLGLTGIYVPEAVAYHAGSATLGAWHADTVRRIARNQVLLVAKHYPPDWIKRYGWCIFVAQFLWGFVALRHGIFLGYVAGKIEGVRRFGGVRGKSCAKSRDGTEFAATLERSEKEIQDLQSMTGFDLFWRLYFALT